MATDCLDSVARKKTRFFLIAVLSRGCSCVHPFGQRMAGSAASGGSGVLGQIPRGEMVPLGKLFRIYETHEPGEHVHEAVPVYRGTSPIRKRPPPYDPFTTL